MWMYYGNPKAPASGNGQRTFDPDYSLLYHFDGATGVPSRKTAPPTATMPRRPCRRSTVRHRAGARSAAASR